jgi:hypothetical protein
MKLVLDYGLVKTAKQNSDGSISFYGRVAVADRQYKYINQDGSTRKEMISRDDLFNKESIDTLKIQTITYPHAAEQLTPDNYGKYSVGSTGNLIVAGLDGDFLGVVGCIKRRDAIDAYNSGTRQLSPGYYRRLRDEDGILKQYDRKYFELSLVPQARGGEDVKIKDSIDYFESMVQMDEDLRNAWNIDAGLNEDAIDRLLTHGTLNPQPVSISNISVDTNKQPFIMQKIKIGSHLLNIDESSSSDAFELVEEFNSLQKSVADAIDTKAKLIALESQTVNLAQQLTDSAEGQKDKLAQLMSELRAATQEVNVFKASGINVDSAIAAIDVCDTTEYRKQIVKAVQTDAVPDTLIDAYYSAHLSAIKKYTNKDELYGAVAGTNMSGANYNTGNYQAPTQISQLLSGEGNLGLSGAGYPSQEASLIAGNYTGTYRGLPEDSETNGWY